MTGTITRLVLESGYGFIESPGQSRSIFLHVSELRGSLEWNEALTMATVEFDIEKTPKGLTAKNVRPAG